MAREVEFHLVVSTESQGILNDGGAMMLTLKNYEKYTMKELVLKLCQTNKV